MKKMMVMLVFAATALGLAAQSPAIHNIGAILDTPFLYQERFPLESVFEGSYYERSVYEYGQIDGFDRPLPVEIALFDYLDEQIGTLTATYSDGRLTGIAFSGDGYSDTYTYTEFGPHGPTAGTIETADGETSTTTITYDRNGYLERLEEEDPYNPGTFWFVVEYRWTETPDGVRPLAVKVELPGNGVVEYYRFLYDARGRLIHLYGDSYYDGSTEPETSSETYFYREDETRFFFLD